MLNTVVKLENVRAIVYDKVICLDSPALVEEVMFILKNWHWDMSGVRLPIL